MASADAHRFAGLISGWIDELSKRTQGGIYDKNGPLLSDPIRSEAERLWRTFPYLLYTVGKPGNFDPAHHAELRELLFTAHCRAMEYLWFLAAKNGVNDLAIREAAHLCQELMRRDFARFYAPLGGATFWPDCLGDEYDLLPGHQRQVIDDGQKAFRELAEKKAPKPAEKTGQATAGKPRMTVEKANEKAMKLARKMRKGFFAFSERQQADEIGCSWATWKKTAFYAEAQRKRPASKLKKPSSPKTESLTAEREAVTGEGDRDEVLKQLAAEQEADKEPSPLECDPPSRPRKIHSRKRL